MVNQQYTLSPFTAAASLTVFTATAVGGLGSALGAVLGAALMEGSAIFLPPAWQMLPAAIGVLIVLLAFPGGVSGLWFTARDRLLERAARRREPQDGQDAAAGAGPDGAVDRAVMTR